MISLIAILTLVMVVSSFFNGRLFYGYSLSLRGFRVTATAASAHDNIFYGVADVAIFQWMVALLSSQCWLLASSAGR